MSAWKHDLRSYPPRNAEHHQAEQHDRQLEQWWREIEGRQGMEIRRRITDEFRIGHVGVTIDGTGDRRPQAVLIRVEDHAVHLEPETLERIARVVEERRREAGDWRSVCVDHGYYDEVECALCRPAAAPAAPTGAEPTPAKDPPPF